MDLDYVHEKMKKAARDFMLFVNEKYVVFNESEVNKGGLVFTDKDGEYTFDEVYNEFLKTGCRFAK